MSPIGLAFVLALIMGAIGLLAGFRISKDNGGFKPAAAVGTAVAAFVLCFFVNWPVIYFGQPMQTVGGLWFLIVMNLFITMVVAFMSDFFAESADAASIISLCAVIGMLIFGFAFDWGAVKSNDSAQELVATVNAVKEDTAKIPETDANHMVIVSDEVASSKANQDLSSGIAGQQSLNTYFNLGAATLQSVDNHMWYVYQLEFDGSGNKSKQNNVVPGYIMVDAEDPDAEPVQHIGNDANTGVDYHMVVSINGGQSEDILRHAYTNGYAGYNLVDPTLELGDDGHPYFTIALQSPTQHWGYDVPVGLLVVDANNGNITRYDLDKIPSWVDRVYSHNTAKQMLNWWGSYAQAPYQLFGSTYAQRYQVSGDAELVYAKGGHPAWRMLMTSFNADTSVNYVVLFDARSNEAKIYTPQNPIGTEEMVMHSFEATSSGNVKANGLKPTDLTLHKLYGRLTWVVSYISEGNNKATFQGVGLLNAYDTNGAGVVFGRSRGAALAAYQTQIATGTGNGNPVENAQTTNVSAAIAERTEVVEGGQTYVYLVLVGDTSHVYRGQAGADSPELIFSKVGDPVTITYLNLGSDTHVRNIKSFDDAKLQLNPVG